MSYTADLIVQNQKIDHFSQINLRKVKEWARKNLARGDRVKITASADPDLFMVVENINGRNHWHGQAPRQWFLN